MSEDKKPYRVHFYGKKDGRNYQVKPNQGFDTREEMNDAIEQSFLTHEADQVTIFKLKDYTDAVGLKYVVYGKDEDRRWVDPLIEARESVAYARKRIERLKENVIEEEAGLVTMTQKLSDLEAAQPESYQHVYGSPMKGRGW